MKKKFLSKCLAFFLAFGLTLSLAACGEYHEASVGPNGPPTSENSGSSDSSSSEITGETFTVKLVLDGKEYVQKSPQMVAQWSDGVTIKRAEFDKDGVATMQNLDGDYYVTLQNLSSKYTYDPNTQLATNDNKDIEIEIFKISSTSGGSGTEASPYELPGEGYYRTNLKRSSAKYFYEFVPQESGTYSVESLLDVNDQTINPKLDVYNSNAGGWTQYSYTQDGGGESKGFTKNFYHLMSVTEEQVGNTFLFAVYAESKNASYPVNVDFHLKYETEAIGDASLNAEWILPVGLYDALRKELNVIRAETYAAWEENYFMQKAVKTYASEKWLEEDEAWALLEEEYAQIQRILSDTEKLKEFNADMGPRIIVDACPITTQYLIESLSTEQDQAYINTVTKLTEMTADELLQTPYYVAALKEDTSGTLATSVRSAHAALVALAQDGDGFTAAEAREGANGYFYDYVRTTSWHNPEVLVSGTYEFQNKMFRLNDGTVDAKGNPAHPNPTGYYHVFDLEKYADNYGFGPIVYANVSSPTRFISPGFTDIEYQGNKALTVTRTENFKLFIEGYARMKAFVDGWEQMYGQTLDLGLPEGFVGMKCYNDFCNDEGKAPVTKELQYFLQNYSVNQRLFMDGNGFCESQYEPQIYAAEDAQWLFAVGWYE